MILCKSGLVAFCSPNPVSVTISSSSIPLQSAFCPVPLTNYAIGRQRGGPYSNRQTFVARASLTSSVSFRVLGLRCGSCIKRCESIVHEAVDDGLDRPVTASADLLTSRLVVTYPSHVWLRGEVVQKVKNALEAGGFSAEYEVATKFSDKSRGSPACETTSAAAVGPFSLAPKQPIFLGLALLAVSAFAQQLCCSPFSFVPIAAQHVEIVSCLIVFLYLLFPLRDMVAAGASDLRRGSMSLSSLVCISVVSQCLVSFSGFFVPSVDPKFHEVVILLAAVQLGRFVEGLVRMYSVRSTEDVLADLQPKSCTRLGTSEAQGAPVQETVDVGAVNVGDILIVKSGERFPVDGVIQTTPDSYGKLTDHGEERTLVDFSAINGEQISYVQRGDRVWAGGINLSERVVLFEATAEVADSEMAVVMQVVGEALGSKSDMQRLVDSAASGLGYVALSIATLVLLMCFAGFKSWLPIPLRSVSHAPFLLASSVLAAACPCSLALAVPGIALVTIAASARQGILFRNAKGLEVAGASSFGTVAIDKTGTITTGNMVVRRVEVVCSDILGNGSGALIGLAASIERFAPSHPVAHAIVSYSQRLELRGSVLNVYVDPVAVTNIPGCGVSAENVSLAQLGVEAIGTVYVGSLEWLSSLDQQQDLNTCLRGDPSTSIVGVFCRELGGLLGVVELEDEFSASLQDIDRLRRLRGFPKLAILSGDNQRSTETVSAAVGICERNGDIVVGNLKPVEKQTLFQGLASRHRQGASVAVGDGVNDGPLLAAADVGIAVGRTGEGVAPVAASAASVVIPNGGLAKVVETLFIGRTARVGMLASIAWSVLYNIMAFFLTSGIGGVYVPPYYASLMMAVSSILSLAFPLVVAAVLERRIRIVSGK